MNKYVLPIILVGMLLTIGVFTFQNVEYATTTDSNVIGEIRDLGDAICNELDFGEVYLPDINECGTIPEGP